MCTTPNPGSVAIHSSRVSSYHCYYSVVAMITTIFAQCAVCAAGVYALTATYGGIGGKRFEMMAVVFREDSRTFVPMLWVWSLVW